MNHKEIIKEHEDDDNFEEWLYAYLISHSLARKAFGLPKDPKILIAFVKLYTRDMDKPSN